MHAQPDEGPFCEGQVSAGISEDARRSEHLRRWPTPPAYQKEPVGTERSTPPPAAAAMHRSAQRRNSRPLRSVAVPGDLSRKADWLWFR